MSTLRELLFKEEQTAVAVKTEVEPKAVTATPTPAPPKTNKLSLSGILQERKEVPTGGQAARHAAYQNLKNRIHKRLVDSIDIQALASLDQSQPLEEAIEKTVHA